jgi:hypothetical protein
MARQSFVIAGESFASKKALIDRIRGILHGYPEKTALKAGDHALLMDLLSRHPEAEQKIGPGVARFWVQTNPVYTNTRNFWALRTDGTTTDFSYLECLNPSTPMQRFHRACRAAVAPDIMDFKVRFFAQRPEYACPYTGEALSLHNAHVDHAIPFASLVAQFIHARQIEVAAVPIAGRAEDHTCLDRFVDRALEQDWRMFHQDQAQYRVVSPTANLSLLRRAT